MKKYYTFILSFFSLFCSAQTYYDDAQLWLNFNLEKKLSDKFLLRLSLKGRGTDNISQAGRGAMDLGIVYKFNKYIKVRTDYVFIQKRRNNGSYRTQHQYYVALILKKDVGKWEFKYRNKFQCRYKNLSAGNENYILYFYDRSQVTVKYEATKRFSFFLAEEIFIPLNNPQVKGLSRSRSHIGTLIKTTKKQQLELYFMYQQQLQNGDWYNQDDSYYPDPLKRLFVYGVGYTIEF